MQTMIAALETLGIAVPASSLVEQQIQFVSKMEANGNLTSEAVEVKSAISTY